MYSIRKLPGWIPCRATALWKLALLNCSTTFQREKPTTAYINPQREVPREAEAVHGLSGAFLKDKPVFSKIADEFLEFIGDTVLIIHNASFDVGFLNAELGFIKRPPILYERIIDTLALAKKRHPMGPNSLDALCKRYGIDIAKRTKHGALLDSELLAGVYLELIGGRQITLTLPKTDNVRHLQTSNAQAPAKRSNPLPERLTAEELARHEALGQKPGRFSPVESDLN